MIIKEKRMINAEFLLLFSLVKISFKTKKGKKKNENTLLIDLKKITLRQKKQYKLTRIPMLNYLYQK
jgi:hypothetical protein